jgi:hypothetical protein
MMPGKEHVRLAAVGDIHYTCTSRGTLQSLFRYMAENADIVLLYCAWGKMRLVRFEDLW